MIKAVLSFPVKEDKILLAVKKKKIGKGLFNGYGGGIEEGETPRQAALRELKEESCIKVTNASILKKVAMIDFRNMQVDGSILIYRVHVFFLYQWQGEFQSTEEMDRPTWFFKKELPFSKMMAADKEWLPIVLSGVQIIGKATYAPFQEYLIGKMEIKEVKRKSGG